jgi:hypothetical protein
VVATVNDQSKLMIPKDLCKRAGWLTHFQFCRDEPPLGLADSPSAPPASRIAGKVFPAPT